MSENLWDALDGTERRFVNLAVRAKSDRQIATQCGTSANYVSKKLCDAKRKLRISGDSKRALTHWYWTQGPGAEEVRMAAVQDTLRELTITAAGVQAYLKRMIATYGPIEKSAKEAPH